MGEVVGWCCLVGSDGGGAAAIRMPGSAVSRSPSRRPTGTGPVAVVVYGGGMATADGARSTARLDRR